MANILTHPTNGAIYFDDSTAGSTSIPALTGDAVSLNYDGSAGLNITSYNTTSTDRFSIDGESGRLFSVNDSLTGTIFSVNDAAGLPVIEVESTSSTDTITMGTYASNALVVAGDRVGVGTASPSSSYKLDVNGAVNIAGDIVLGGALDFTGSIPAATSDTDTFVVVDSGELKTRTGAQVLSDIGALSSETVTSLALTSGSLVYTDENGTDTSISLAAYLDEDSRSIASGSLNSSTGVVTFTRDDSTTFTLDLGPLLDDTNLVTSVAGKSGVVTLVKGDVGLGNVTNESKATMFSNPSFTGDVDVAGSITTEGPDGGMVMRTWPGGGGYGMIGTANMGTNEYVLLTTGGDTFISAGGGASVHIRGGGNDANPSIDITPTNIEFNSIPSKASEATALVWDGTNVGYRELGSAAFSATSAFAAASHTHAASDITSGNLDNARMPTHVDIGGKLDIGVSSNYGTTTTPNMLWISPFTTGQSDVPGSYYDIINLSSSSSHGIQIASFYGAGSGGIYMRTRSDNASAPAGVGLQAWNKLWHNNNDGSSSGLDADLLDGQHASAFSPVAGSTSLTTAGVLTVDQLNMRDVGDYITFYGDDSANHAIAARDSAGSIADDIRINSYGAVYINLDSNNNNTSSANFQIGRHGANTTISDWLFTVDGENGNVGIGTTGPTANLQVGNNYTINSSYGGSNLYIKGSSENTSYDPQTISTSDIGSLITISDSTTTGPTKAGLVLYNDDVTAGGFSPMLLFSKRESGSTPFKATMAGIYARSPLGTGNSGNWIDGELIFATAGAASQGIKQRMVINKEGNVGIGTTSPDSRLELAVASTADMVINANDRFKIRGNGTAIWGNSASNGELTWDSGYAIIKGQSGNGLKLAVNNSTNTGVTINTSGNVGIGTTTPQNKLDVYLGTSSAVASIGGRISVGGYAGLHFGYSEDGNSSYRKSAIVFERTDLTTNNAQGKVHILNGPQTGSGSATLSDAKLTIAENGDVGIGTTSPIGMLSVVNPQANTNTWTPTNKPDLWVSNAGTSNSYYAFGITTSSGDILSVTNAGNVGIGTTSPSNTLDIAGGLEVNAEAYIRSTNNVGLRIQNTNKGITSTDGLRVGLNDSHAFVWQYENLPLSFATNGSQKATILANGNFGIGTSVPDFKLDVAGDIGIDGKLYHNGDHNTYIGFGSDDIKLRTGGTDVITVDSSQNVGIGTTSPSHKLEVGLTSSVALANQPAEPLFVSNDGNGVDGRVFISVKHDGVNTASAIGAGFKMTAAAVTSGTASYDDSLIFLKSAGSSNVTVHSAPRDIQFYVDNHGTNAGSGANYNDLGDLALTIGEDTNATFAGNIIVSGTVDGRDVAADGTKLDGIASPNAPTSVSASIVGETIDLTFNASSTSNIDAYLVYSSVDGGDYGLIQVIPPDDFSATMSVIDSAFTVTGTQAYRVYAMKYGILSSAGTASVSYTVSSAEPTDMSVVNLNNAYFVQWNPPSANERFVSAYNVYKHEAAASGSLSRSSASLIYSGLNTNFMYQISGNNNSNYHQFWVETTIA